MFEFISTVFSVMFWILVTVLGIMTLVELENRRPKQERGHEKGYERFR